MEMTEKYEVYKYWDRYSVVSILLAGLLCFLFGFTPTVGGNIMYALTLVNLAGLVIVRILASKEAEFEDWHIFAMVLFIGINAFCGCVSTYEVVRHTLVK